MVWDSCPHFPATVRYPETRRPSFSGCDGPDGGDLALPAQARGAAKSRNGLYRRDVANFQRCHCAQRWDPKPGTCDVFGSADFSSMAAWPSWNRVDRGRLRGQCACARAVGNRGFGTLLVLSRYAVRNRVSLDSGHRDCGGTGFVHSEDASRCTCSIQARSGCARPKSCRSSWTSRQ